MLFPELEKQPLKPVGIHIRSLTASAAAVHMTYDEEEKTPHICMSVNLGEADRMKVICAGVSMD